MPFWTITIFLIFLILQKDKLEALIREIDNGFENGHIKEDHIEDVVDCTKELGEMISTGKLIRDWMIFG